MQNLYNQEVADYLNNKFGDDYTMSQPTFVNPIKLEQEPKEVVFRNWSRDMDDVIRRYYTENDRDEKENLVAFVI